MYKSRAKIISNIAISVNNLPNPRNIVGLRFFISHSPSPFCRGGMPTRTARSRPSSVRPLRDREWMISEFRMTGFRSSAPCPPQREDFWLLGIPLMCPYQKCRLYPFRGCSCPHRHSNISYWHLLSLRLYFTTNGQFVRDRKLSMKKFISFSLAL